MHIQYIHVIKIIAHYTQHAPNTNIFSMFYVSPSLNFTGPSPVCGSISLVIRIADTPGVSRNIISGLIISKYLNSGVNVAKYRQVRNAISHSEIVDVRWAPYICKDTYPTLPINCVYEYNRVWPILSIQPQHGSRNFSREGGGPTVIWVWGIFLVIS